MPRVETIPPKGRKGIFIPMNGVFIKPQQGRPFPKDINDWEINGSVLSRIKVYYAGKFIPFVLSNIGELNDGKLNRETFIKKRDLILDAIDREIGDIPIYFEFCDQPNTEAWMPNPGMAHRTIRSNGVVLKDSIMITATPMHIEFARKAGIKRTIPAEQFITGFKNQ